MSAPADPRRLRNRRRDGRMRGRRRGFVCRRALSVPAGLPQISLSRVAGGFASPVHVTHAGDGSGRIFVVEQAGRIRILDNGARASDAVSGHRFLNPPRLVCGRRAGPPERGLPPRVRGEKVFLRELHQESRTAPRWSPATASPPADANVADPASEEVILTVPQPFANHNGGTARLRSATATSTSGWGTGARAATRWATAQNPGDAAREDPPHRRGVGHGALRRSPDQSVRGQRRLPPGDLGAGAAEPVALLLRPRDGGPLYRRRGTGTLRGDRLPAGRRAGGQELRLEHHGGRPLLPPRDRRLQPRRPCPPGLRSTTTRSGAP